MAAVQCALILEVATLHLGAPFPCLFVFELPTSVAIVVGFTTFYK